MAGHGTFSGTLHKFPASCLSDRTTCPLILTALPQVAYSDYDNLMPENFLICPSNCKFVKNLCSSILNFLL